MAKIAVSQASNANKSVFGNGRHSTLFLSETQSKFQSTVQSMSPVQSPAFAPTGLGLGVRVLASLMRDKYKFHTRGVVVRDRELHHGHGNRRPAASKISRVRGKYPERTKRCGGERSGFETNSR